MKKTLALIMTLTLSLPAMAFQTFMSREKYKCFDDVSSYTYEFHIIDIGDEEATVRVKTKDGRGKFYPSTHVVFNPDLDKAYFVLLDKNKKPFERLTINGSVAMYGSGHGLYEGRADSRVLDCTKVRY